MHARPIEIGRKLVRTIDAQCTTGADGKTNAPNVFVVKLSEADRTALGDLEIPLIGELADAAKQYADDEGYRMIGSVSVSIITDATLKAGRFEIVAEARIDTEQAAKSAPESKPAVVPAPPMPPATPPTTATPSIPPVPTPAPVEEKKAVLILADGTKIAVRPGVLSIGRSAESSVPLNDTNVSRRHAEIRSRGEGAGIEWLLADVGSTNGTMLNGVKINGEQRLKHGDSIMFGNTSARFEIA